MPPSRQDAAVPLPEGFTAALLDTLAAPVVALDRAGRVVLLNRACERLAGRRPEEVRGRPWWELVPPGDAGAARAAFEGALAGAGPQQTETDCVGPDGARRRVAWTLAPLRGTDGAVQLVLGSGADVTDRRLGEAVARESDARFRALIERATDMIVVVDAEARIRFWSPSATETLGWTAEEVLGRQTFELIHPDDAPRIRLAAARSVASPGATVRLAMRVRHKDGGWRLIESLRRNLLHDPAVHGVVVNMRDVTEQRRLEEAAHQSRRMESIGQLAGGVAHDFNNLLTVILTCVEALQQDLAAGAPVNADDVAEIRAAGERARDLTRQLLTFARRQVIAPVPIDLDRLLRESRKLVRRVLGEGVELVVDLQPGPWSVCCDPGQLEQVVLNLAVNARDAMPEGGTLTLRTANVEVDERTGPPGLRPGQYVRLSVSDTGHGMSPEVKGRIFEPFFTTKAQGKGTGLGLASVYGIVAQNHGCVLVESEPGRGSTFDVYLPRSVEAAAAPRPGDEAAAAGGSETVLVVEDDPSVREVTVRSLRAGGYRVLVGTDGRHALELAAAEEGSIDLLVTDLVMPGLDGRAVAETLRRVRPALRVLYVSGFSRAVIAEHGMLDPGVELLQKPFTAASLLARVRAVLGARAP